MTDYTRIAGLPTTGGAGCALKAEPKAQSRVARAIAMGKHLGVSRMLVDGVVVWRRPAGVSMEQCRAASDAEQRKAPTVTVNYACGGQLSIAAQERIWRQIRAAAPRREYLEPCRATFLDVTGLADDKQRLVKIGEPHDPNLASALEAIGLDAEFRKAAGDKWEMKC